ncbi:molybdopterin oxidoreductase family protein [Dactylosporangium sp. CS-047395]|uniref:molybdopterin oxidoreductase family protein n=1 Tax=Dactylosporangium sp. CS-047395 TaxID=3239936 RepID=UPI003D8C8B9C
MDDRITDPWGPRTPYGPGEPWPVRVDAWPDPSRHGEPDRWVRSASVLHSNGDGIDIAVRDGRIAGVRGRAGDRINRGRLDPKDVYGWQASNSPDRLTTPLVRRDGRLVETGWDTALDLIAARSRALLARPGGRHRFGFYTSGQLFLEEYYTLSVLARAGIGTPHLDGNTRLCTATAAAALKESFGADGQPGSYGDIDLCDAIALWGHNVAETQAVLWMRMLDRRCGPNPPAMLVADPRDTPVARAADVHLPLRPGTNVALLNGLLYLLLTTGRYDPAYVAAHTSGFDGLMSTVRHHPPRVAAAICGLEVRDLERAADLLGGAERLVSTVLQGVYQSNQATAAAVQVNNLHLIRGMIGRPGAGVLQMNGQPTAQNARETGADGDLPGFRNWANPAHVRDLAELWDVDEDRIPHDGPPTHALEIFAGCERGDIDLLWVSATNPAVSMPRLDRIRRILGRDELFLVVQDLFPTETTEFADVVLPAAGWGEKTGTFTNADRTVHLSERAADPPGQARPDLDIFLAYARAMDFRTRSGRPLIPWRDAEGAYAAWQRCSAGRPCDYTGLTYERLRGDSGVQWPLGVERLYAGGHFATDPDYCETYGHDLATGADLGREHQPATGGRAALRPAEYRAAPEVPGRRYPLSLVTGRTIYQFHTRTKTGRAPQLDAAAPEPWVELHPDDAAALGVADGDLVCVESARGRIKVAARTSGIRRGVVFVPFHYAAQAANELTATALDPVSKQPLFKSAAVGVFVFG